MATPTPRGAAAARSIKAYCHEGHTLAGGAAACTPDCAVYRFAISSTGWAAIAAAVDALVARHRTLPGGGHRVLYLDSEGDLCRISSDAEWEEYLNQYRATSCLLLHVVLDSHHAAPKPTPARPAPSFLSATGPRPHSALYPVEFGVVQWKSGFWGRRVALVHDASVAAMKAALEHDGNGAQIANFTTLASKQGGAWLGDNWGDGDCYKWVETMINLCTQQTDPAMEAEIESYIDLFVKCQADDGYLSTKEQLTTTERWSSPMNHELYNQGHLMTTAVVHYKATQKTTFLNVAIRLADYLVSVSQQAGGGPDAFRNTFNPSQMMGLVDLYRVTQKKEYLDLARTFVLNRGEEGGTDQNQNRVPFLKETMAVGHAVTGPYLWCGAIDVYAETGEQDFLDASERIYLEAHTGKVYVTGIFGQLHSGASERDDVVHEAFGPAYFLPNFSVYGESCANICNAMWSWRLLNVTGDCAYADSVETVLYNSGLSGMSADGKLFRYANPMAVDQPLHINLSDTPERWPWHSCWCCPPNITRTIAGLHRWAVSMSRDGKGAFVHLYDACTVALADLGLSLAIDTQYPWEGQVIITVTAAPTSGTTIPVHLRIPGWAQGTQVTLNDDKPVSPPAGAYFLLDRAWRAGDRILLQFPFEPVLVTADARVKSNAGRVAVRRGPIVYCLEGVDTTGPVLGLGVTKDTKLTPEHKPDFLGGVTVLHCNMTPLPTGRGQLYRPLSPRAAGQRPGGAAASTASTTSTENATVAATLVPYFAWNNRGVCQMAVWLPLVSA